jgi:hypothetical protein
MPMHASSSPEERLSQLVDGLISGFEELLSTLRSHVENEKALQERIEFAADEVS